MAPAARLDPRERRQTVLAAVAERLSTPEAAWQVEGDRVLGEGPVAIIVGERCDADRPRVRHVDLGVVLDADRPGSPVIWDRATGFESDERAAIEHAVRIWEAGTMPVIHELFAGDGRHADHYPPDDPHGLTGWHVIAGPVWGWSAGGSAEPLQRWAAGNPLLRGMVTLGAELDRPAMNGVRVFFGGRAGDETAEVRVNGRVTDRPAMDLLRLDWPRLAHHAYLSRFFLAVHPA